MSIFDNGLINYIQFFWVSTIYLIIWLALRRIKPSIKAFDWNYSTSVAHIKPRGNVITLLKIYSKLVRSTPREMSVDIRDELSSNASTFFDKPQAFFVKYRSDERVMSQYFQDAELRLFFKDPRFWAITNGGMKTSFFGLIRDENSPSDEFHKNLERILAKFEKEIARGKRTITNETR